MSYFFREPTSWFKSPLCCRYTVVQFGKLRVPMRIDGAPVAAEWHWALGLFTDGQFEVLGSWRDEGPSTAERIAADLHDRGLVSVSALAAADDGLAAGVQASHPQIFKRTVAELAESGVTSGRMQPAIHWTDTVVQRLQERMSRVVSKHEPFADHETAADFIARTFQRADRALLSDYWGRAKPAPYGRSAAPRVLARAA